MAAGARRRSGKQKGSPARQRNSSLLVSARQLQALVRRLPGSTSQWTTTLSANVSGGQDSRIMVLSMTNTDTRRPMASAEVSIRAPFSLSTRVSDPIVKRVAWPQGFRAKAVSSMTNMAGTGVLATLRGERDVIVPTRKRRYEYVWHAVASTAEIKTSAGVREPMGSRLTDRA